MRIAIVDDNERDLLDLKELLLSELDRLGHSDASVSLFSSGEDFLSSWQAGVYSLIFLDIFMGNMSGVDIAHEIRKTDLAVSIVFSTTSNEFASQSYDVGASFYLHKPLERSRIALMLQRIDRIRLAHNRFIVLPDGSRHLIRDIMYTERWQHYLTVHFASGKSKEVRITQQKIGQLLLPHHEFYAVGQGSIVNFEYVGSLYTGGFLMRDGKFVPIPRRQYKTLRAAYELYCFERSIRGDM